MKKNKAIFRRFVFGALIVAILLGGVVYGNLRSKDRVIHPSVGPISEAAYGLGRVVSNHHFEVITGVMTTMEKIYVREGQSVKKGDLLMRISSSVDLRTPVAGSVTLVKIKDGETILPQTPVLRVEDLRDCYIEISLPQEAAIRVRKGMRARVSFESIRNKVLEGQVIAIFPRENEFLAQVDVPTLDPGILPGMTADVVIEVGETRDATLIPAKAVEAGSITIRRRGHWVRQKIEIGYVDGTHVEVMSPVLTAADEIRLRRDD